MTFFQLYFSIAIATFLISFLFFLREAYKEHPADIKELSTFIGLAITSSMFGLFWGIFLIVLAVDHFLLTRK